MQGLPGRLQVLEQPALAHGAQRQPVHRHLPEPAGPEREHPHHHDLQRDGGRQQGRHVGVRPPRVPALQRRALRLRLPGQRDPQGRGQRHGDARPRPVHRVPVLLDRLPVRRPALHQGRRRAQDAGQQVHRLRRPHRAGAFSRMRHHLPTRRPQVRTPRRDGRPGPRARRDPQGARLRERVRLRRERDGRPARHPGPQVRRRGARPGRRRARRRR